MLCTGLIDIDRVAPEKSNDLNDFCAFKLNETVITFNIKHNLHYV